MALLKKIKTLNGCYIYDACSDSLLKVSRSIYSQVYDNKISNQKIISFLEREYGLDPSFKIKALLHPDTNKLQYLLDKTLEQLTLQITQQCNLACSYCPYADFHSPLQRNHSNKSMIWEIAQKSIDFFLAHSVDNDEITISFYGGEPLLAFPLIKKSIEYIKKKVTSKKYCFSLTTNATLLEKDICEFLVDNNFSLLLSIDGNEEIHNLNRVFATGEGSYKCIKNNIMYLMDYCSEQYLSEKVKINMVVDPQSDFDKLLDFFSDPFWTPINKQISMIDDKYLSKKYLANNDFIAKLEYCKFLTLLKDMRIVDSNIKKEGIFESYIHELFNKYKLFFERNSILSETACPSGPCTAGKRRLFVDVYGNFYPCEHVSENCPTIRIGNIATGFDMNSIKKIINIAQLTEEECKECWCLRHCQVCIADAENGGEISAEAKKTGCAASKQALYTKLREAILRKEYFDNY